MAACAAFMASTAYRISGRSAQSVKWQGKNLANAAKKAGVEHFVYSSVGGAERDTGIGHWESKWEIEKHIRKLGLPTTVLRPAAFMENYYVDQVEIGILQGKLYDPVRADKPYQTIASDDIGGFVALAFERPKDFMRLELEIAGSELTNLQAAEVFSKVLGRPVEIPGDTDPTLQRVRADVPLVQREGVQRQHRSVAQAISRGAPPAA